MKVRAALALACSSLAHGAAVSVKRLPVGFGPKNCVALSRSPAGSCVITTDCQDADDLSTTEFAFDCVASNSVVRHSFGTGGFDSSEEFDTEVKCDRCDLASPADVVVKPAAAKPTNAPEEPKAAPVPAKRPVAKTVPKVPEKMPAAVIFKARTSPADTAEDAQKDVHEDAKEVHKDVVEVIDDAETNGEEKPKSEVTRYGPDGCVSTWKSPEGHCIMRTDCAKSDISKYQFGLVCVDKVGSPVRHLFGRDSFDKEETFDTLIKCDKCMGLEDIPDAVALNGEVVTMSKDIDNLKAVMKNISLNVQMLNEEVFGKAPAAAAPAQVAPAAPAKSLIHHSATHQRTSGQSAEADTGKTRNLRHSHKKKYRRHDEDDYDDDDDEGYDDRDRQDGYSKRDDEDDEDRDEGYD